MIQRLTYLLTTFLAIITLSTTLHADPVTLTLDNKHSYVLWTIKHLGFSTQAGKWYAQGELVLDKDHLNKSKVNVTINVANIVTGLPDFDAHLKGKLFFNTEKFPTATFVSDKVQVLGKNKAKVHGMLTLLGVTKPVVLNVTLNKVGINPVNNKNTAGFSATASIKRSDFGMTTLLPDVSDVVNLEIGVEASENKQ